MARLADWSEHIHVDRGEKEPLWKQMLTETRQSAAFLIFRNHRNYRALVRGVLTFRISNCSIIPVHHSSWKLTKHGKSHTNLHSVALCRSLQLQHECDKKQCPGLWRSAVIFTYPTTMVGKIAKQLVFHQSSLWNVEGTRLMRLVAISDHRSLGPIYQLQLGE